MVDSDRESFNSDDTITQTSFEGTRPMRANYEMSPYHPGDTEDDVEAGHPYVNGNVPILREATPGYEEEVEDKQYDVKRIASKKMWRDNIVAGLLIVAWYIFSISISVYNKWMFGGKQLSFHFPLFVTSVHMLVQFSLATLTIWMMPSLRPKSSNSEEDNTNDERQTSMRSSSRQSSTASARASRYRSIMPLSVYVKTIAPCAIATGLDIGLGNTSLRFVTLTFFTMVKSSTLLFVLGFAIMFGLEFFSWKLAGIILGMTVGVVMMVFGETDFSALGFGLLLGASACSGLRWSLTQMLLKQNPATSNPFASLFFLTPVMFVVLFILAIFAEGFGPLFQGLAELSEKKGAVLSGCILVFPGCLAFCMTVAEFALLMRTSVVTLSVGGIFKEVLTIAAGGIVFDDKLTIINASGLVVTFFAIVAYNVFRYKKAKKEAIRDAQEQASEEQAPMLDDSGSQQRDDSQHVRGRTTSRTLYNNR